MRLLRSLPQASRSLRISRVVARIVPTSRSASSFAPPPSPLRLPKEDQEIFEELQRKSTGAFSTPQSESSPTDSPNQSTSSQSQKGAEVVTSTSTLNAQIKAAGEGEELHPHVRRGAKPEFEGDVNPKTGEVNGPKNEPQRWGASGDYSFNGRVTDF
jgi:hypothetical protein